INVTEIEELQTIGNTDALGRIFSRAERTIIGGEKVILVRRHADGRTDKFDELSTEKDLAAYREQVFKYLK
ncbi:MAG TPA: hypothetical protein VHK69_13695, partial [Chitinophagaceae bacterium]|nr:hypothetical protein [Chitinophagaceae bacterium]